MKIQKYVLFQIFQGVEKSILESGIKIKQEKIFRYIKADSKLSALSSEKFDEPIYAILLVITILA